MKKARTPQSRISGKLREEKSVRDPWELAFALFAGVFIGLLPLKFGNPVIFEQMVFTPKGIIEIIYSPWPLNWGYLLLGALVLTGWKSVAFGKRGFHWILLLPCVWGLWQFVSASGTIDETLTHSTLKHQVAIVICFYLGYFALSHAKNLGAFWTGATIGLVFVLWSGFQQHYGGLEDLRSIPPETLIQFFGPDGLPPLLEMKLQSDRIFGTLVYPNALAGTIILYLPPALATVWALPDRAGTWTGKILLGLVLYMGVACLVWSGSKAGWLISLGMLLFAVLHLPIKQSIRTGLLISCCILGLTAFGLKYADYFKRGATSAVARIDYWKAGAETFLDNPIMGSGPGTFGPSYKSRKSPESEMAQLAHNDYLQQASDSGLIGFASYAVFVWGSLFCLYLKLRNSDLLFPKFVWLGIFGWALQGFVEFGLYIPALSWTTFLLLGWLWGSTRSPVTDESGSAKAE